MNRDHKETPMQESQHGIQTAQTDSKGKNTPAPLQTPYLHSKQLLAGVALEQRPLTGLALQQVGGQSHLATCHLTAAAAAAAAAPSNNLSDTSSGRQNQLPAL
jgi:hypothetical protein